MKGPVQRCVCVVLVVLQIIAASHSVTISQFTVQTCVADDHLGEEPCTLAPVPNIRVVRQPVTADCDATHGLAGSVTYVDLSLPAGKVLFIQVTTNVPGQNANRGFFIRPTRISRSWGPPTVTGATHSHRYHPQS